MTFSPLLKVPPRVVSHSNLDHVICHLLGPLILLQGSVQYSMAFFGRENSRLPLWVCAWCAHWEFGRPWDCFACLGLRIVFEKQWAKNTNTSFPLLPHTCARPARSTNAPHAALAEETADRLRKSGVGSGKRPGRSPRQQATSRPWGF